MSELYEKSLLKLELPQVLQLLSACAIQRSCFPLKLERKI